MPGTQRGSQPLFTKYNTITCLLSVQQRTGAGQEWHCTLLTTTAQSSILKPHREKAQGKRMSKYTHVSHPKPGHVFGEENV